MKPLHLCNAGSAGAASALTPSAFVAVRVTVHQTQGSAPREAGCQMVVTTSDLFGTVGGGHLEYAAIQNARNLLKEGLEPQPNPQIQRYALGPSMGQCCGGVVWLAFEMLDSAALANVAGQATQALPKLAIFGGGHVGEALVRQFLLLDFSIYWVDSRDAIFPEDLLLAHGVKVEYSQPVEAAVRDIVPHSHVLIMSFSHAEDFALVEVCLRRQQIQRDLSTIGLIGSQSKWARFKRRLTEKGFTETDLAHVRCPIGLSGLAGKAPAQIAVAVAAGFLSVSL